MIRDHKLWTWHLATAAVILVLLGLHMAIMHLDALLGIFNPAGGHPIDWANVAARGRTLFFPLTYILLLAAALFHGLYGLRNVLLETAAGRAAPQLVGWGLTIVGGALFVLGAWAAWAGRLVAATG